MAFESILSPYGNATSAAYQQAAAGPLATLFTQPGKFTDAYGQVGSASTSGMADVGKTYLSSVPQLAAAHTGNLNAYMGGLGKAMDGYTNNTNSYMGGLGSLGNSAASMYAANANGIGSTGNSLANAYGAYANGLGAASQAQAQGIGSLGNSLSGAYGSYASGLGNVANALANERSNFYAGNAQAEAARQAALGNIGVASLGAFGGASNSALAAWAQNQQAYNKALSDINAANQSSLSAYGQSRNAGLSPLGSAYSDLGGKLAGASALGNLTMNFGGDFGGGASGSGFTASGPDGTIASGTYGGTSGGEGGGFYGNASRVSDTGQLDRIGSQAYGNINSLRDNLMAGDITGSLNNNAADAMGRLDRQHYSSRTMPSEMLGQTLSGLLAMGRDAYNNSRDGMDQFYGVQSAPSNRADYSGILRQLSSGFGDTRGDLSSMRGDINSNIRNVGNALDSGYSSAASDIGHLAQSLNNNYSSGLGGIGALGNQMGGAFAIGNQRIDSALPLATRGFNLANNNVNSVADQMASGAGGAYGAIGNAANSGYGALSNLWNNSAGKLFSGMALTPLEKAQQQRAADLFNRRADMENRAFEWDTSPLHNAYARANAQQYRNDLRLLPVA